MYFRDAFAAARELGLHVRARQSPYPLSDQQRYPVPDFLVDWQVILKGRLPFDQDFRNFRNGDKWYGNFLGKVPENPEFWNFEKRTIQTDFEGYI